MRHPCALVSRFTEPSGKSSTGTRSRRLPLTGGQLRRRPLRRGGPRTLLVALVLIAAALLAILLGSGGARPAIRQRAARARADAHASRPRPTTGQGSVAPAGGAPPGSPSAAGRALSSAVAAAMAKAGGRWGAAVLDLNTGALLVDLGGGVARAPASVEKIYTSVAALRLLGPDARFATRLLGTGKLGRDEVWDGNLYLRGGGDPTFGDGTFNRIYERGLGPTGTQLARQLLAHGIRHVTGRLYGDGSLFSDELGGMLTHLRPDIPDLGGELGALVYDHGEVTRTGASPAVFAASELAATLRTMGVRVQVSRLARATPAGASVLGTVRSPPLRVLLSLMNVPSDDLIAEMLDEQLGLRFGAGGSIQAGAEVIAQTIKRDYGLSPRILDGSGLDPADRTTPLQVVQFLRELWGTPDGRLLDASLPVVGRSGTVTTIALKTAAVGRCDGKTGTLTDVSNLVGYCAARGGHELAFALFDDGPPNWFALQAIGQALGAIARW
jgi:D-alanyl-D-alanine carboxypeptidase/D-alanyl-D-alanine-endopeptidase (penicillin-binding protein 4)